MTKAEIIRKLAKRVGVQDLDAKIFFEVFLKKVSLQLNPGETIRINNIGFFQLRTGKIKHTSENDSQRDQLLVDLIVYHPLQNQLDETSGNLIFNIPGKSEEEYNVIDSYFSLSFGKPVIPLKDANVSEYFIPPTGNELRRLYDTKADKILQEVEVVEAFTKGDEILLIDPELINPNQMEINWDEINNEPSSPEKILDNTEQTSLKEPEIYSWEFGDELEKQIEEDALLDTENENNLFSPYDDLKDLSWDFGETFTSIEPLPLPPEIPVQKDLDQFQRVKSFTSDYNIDHNSTSHDVSEKEEDSDLIKSINEELNDEGFAEIKHIPRNYHIEPVMDDKVNEKVDENLPPLEIENEEYEPETFGNLIPEPPVYNEVDLSTRYSRKKWLGLYVAFAIILVLAGSVLLYIKVVNPYYAGVKKVPEAKVDSYNTPPVIIERDYEIPVTYPYTKDSNIVHPFDPIDKNVFAQTDNTRNNDSITAKPKEQNNPAAPVQKPVLPEVKKSQQLVDNKVSKSSLLGETKVTKSPQSLVKVKDFIYRSDNIYLVQISSWSSKSKALDHASWFKKKGYQTEIEMANLTKGTYYRVRVGNFKSENEAVQFYNKYK